MIKQLSILAENKKGVFMDITGILKDADINILGSFTHDGIEFGTIRMIVSDPEKAQKLLTEADFLCRMATVIGVEIPDDTGSLHSILEVLNEANVNLNYTYLCYNRENGKPIIILHTPDIYEVENLLTSRGYVVQKS